MAASLLTSRRALRGAFCFDKWCNQFQEIVYKILSVRAVRIAHQTKNQWHAPPPVIPSGGRAVPRVALLAWVDVAGQVHEVIDHPDGVEDQTGESDYDYQIS